MTKIALKTVDGKPKYEVSVGASSPEEFDIVVIAAPLEFANITFEGIDVPQQNRAFQVTHVTLVTGNRGIVFEFLLF